MNKTEKIWRNGEFVDWDDCKIHALTYGLHYGIAAFEGIRFYKTDKGPVVFRLREHIERLFESAKVILMNPPYTVDEICEAVLETIRVNNVDAGYIRPLFWYGYGKLFLDPEGMPEEFMIAVWPWGKYLGHEAIKVKTSDMIRPHPKSFPMNAKLSGTYVNSVLASVAVRREGYREALMLDHEGNVAEGPGENFFMIKDGKLITPALGSILPGITRDSIIQIAKDEGMEVEERTVTLDEVRECEECFFTGTAAEVTGIGSLDDKQIGNGDTGPVTQKLKDIFDSVISGNNEKYEGWLSYVNK